MNIELYESRVQYYINTYRTQLQGKNAAHFTGHRPKYLQNGYNVNDANIQALIWEMRAVIEACVRCGITTFYSGMALGVDTWAFRLVQSLKTYYPQHGLQIIAVLPCIEQDKRWSQKDKDAYATYVDEADATIYTTTTTYAQNPRCMTMRDRQMVDVADVTIAICNPSITRSGTKTTVEMAQNSGNTVIQIDPRMFHL